MGSSGACRAMLGRTVRRHGRSALALASAEAARVLAIHHQRGEHRDCGFYLYYVTRPELPAFRPATAIPTEVKLTKHVFRVAKRRLKGGQRVEQARNMLDICGSAAIPGERVYRDKACREFLKLTRSLVTRHK